MTDSQMSLSQLRKLSKKALTGICGGEGLVSIGNKLTLITSLEGRPINFTILTNEVLQEVLKSWDMPVSGAKKDLVERIKAGMGGNGKTDKTDKTDKTEIEKEENPISLDIIDSKLVELVDQLDLTITDGKKKAAKAVKAVKETKTSKDKKKEQKEEEEQLNKENVIVEEIKKIVAPEEIGIVVAAVVSAIDQSPQKKKAIPRHVKTIVWNTWVGEDISKTKCLACGVTEIHVQHFHCGHVLAESKGGETNVKNLRPICGNCNLSMASMDMTDYVRFFGREMI